MAAVVESTEIVAHEALTSRPLKFGDAEQIKALRDINREASEGENVYTVQVTFNGSQTLMIRADSEEEAEEIAREEADTDWHMEIDTYILKKTKG